MNNSEQIIVCGGCNAKIGPGQLGELLKDLPKKQDNRLLVGFESSDDAAVIKLNEEQAIIQTLDFFPPMVTDPYMFGKIAAANALSDVYAMGGDVVSALNVVAFPEDKPLTILKEILRGGAEKVQEAGGLLVGGHSIHDHSIKYGLSVNGIINPQKILSNNTPKSGDYLILTKPLGVGIITTGFQVSEIDTHYFEQAVKNMQTLNKYAMDVARHYDISSCTDITGFGLLGHLHEMLDGRLSACLYSNHLPILDGALKAASDFILTAGGQRNRNYLSNFVSFHCDDFSMEEILFDPQTSGGLLFSVPANQADDLITQLKQELDSECAIIGQVIDKQAVEIAVY
ncbi:selenide, water dikinase SelD [Vagococcus zengguangii]|uniref:Selenide, water dikinase n=1 Tax=Vagococcus zengguangii TaxID=2571750 RepID=A0A4D7CWA1_9ENTE|nr:selenide, water dikinase SelD [Vagococcus zengguangii]QCI86440.1 selenide, water dikinase SelD [Vagococcus zengguangii]TLG81310.1 selenide, water dikinase SelD [Vagococcus zengguangii]